MKSVKRRDSDLAETTGEAFLQVGRIVKKGDFKNLFLFGFGCLPLPLVVCCVGNGSAQSCEDWKKNNLS